MKKQRFIRRYLCLSVVLLGAGLPAALQAVDFSTVPGKVLDYQSLTYDLFYTTPRIFISDPEIAVLSDGSYVAAHALAGRNSGSATSGKTTIFRSTDKGVTWTTNGLFNGILRGGLFEHNGAVYILGANDDDDGKPAVVMQSLDGGITWTNSAQFASFGGPATPNNPVALSNRLWIATGTSDLSAPITSNLLLEASWKSTGGFPASSADWISGTSFVGEGQIVASPLLGVFILPKVAGYPLTAVSRVSVNSGSSAGAVTFDPTNNFAALPGGEKKFGAAYDPVSSNFYVLSNPILPLDSGSGIEPDMVRNTAAVLTSRDLLNWKVEKIFLYSADLSHEGFGYLNFDFDGTNMVAASRTAWVIPGETPPNDGRAHDSNLLTIHRIDDFRNIAPDHYLKISGNQILRYERTPETKDDDAPLGSFTLGSTALTSPNGMGQAAAGDIYIREAGGRILRFDAAGNFVETNSSAPVSFQSANLTVKQPIDGECAWSRSGSGDWFEPLSWYYWGRPDTTEEIAVFGSAATAATTVNIPSETQVWNFNTDGDKEGWVASNTNYLDMVITNGVLQGTALATNGVFVSRSDRFFYGSTVPEVRIRMKADANCPVYFYWGTTLAVPSQPARRLTGSYTGNGEFQELIFSMAGNANWDGQAITLIRFDPQVQTNVAGSKGFAIDSITVPKESYRMKGLRFRSASPYTLSGGGQLRIEANSGTGTVEVLQGKHTNNVELVLGSDTDMILTNNTSLHLKQGIDLNGKTLHVSGSGKLLMQDSLVMNGGTLAISGATPLTLTNNSTGAVLDGTLQLLPEGTFAPTIGTSFDLLDNPSVLGTKKFAAVSLPALPSGQQWNTNALYTTGNVTVEAAPYSLIVATPYGKANPPAGTNTYDYGTNLTAALTNSPVLNGTTTQYVCRGWSGTGSVPSSGTSTNTASFTLTTNSTLTWLWTTNYWLDTATNGNGSVNVSDGWKTNGASVQITAAPGADWLFTAWSGNTNGCTINGNIITAPMTAARTITANFEVDPLSLPNTWQLDSSGTWTNPVNWTDGIIPGISGGSNSSDVVIFSATLTTNRVVTVDANRNIGGIIFANPANTPGTNNTTSVAYTLSGGTIKLSNGGVIQVNDLSGTNISTISSAIVIQGNGGLATFRNDAPGGIAGLAIGAVTGTSTVGNVTTLYLDGVSTSSGIGATTRNNTVGAIGNGTGGGKLAVVKNGSGLWTLSANSTYTGGLFLNAGTLRYYGNGPQFGGTGNIISIGTNVTFNHANGALITNTQPLVVNGDFSLIGSANTLWSGAVDLGAVTRTITVSTSANTNNTFSGVFSNGGLIKAGVGELILSGSNTYALGTAVSAGTLIGVSDSALGTSNITVSGGATLTLSATNCIGNQALLTLATNAVLNLNFTGADTVGGISRDGGATWLPSGTYNAAALGADGPGSLVIPASSYLLTGSVSGGNGTVSPTSTNVTAGGSATFLVTASNYYRIASLTTNGTPAGLSFNNNSTSTNFIWSNIQSTGAVVATFTAQITTDPANTPYSWMAQYGLTNFSVDAGADGDHDGLTTWQEYLAGTNPTNPASVFKITGGSANSQGSVIRWSSASNRFYDLSRTTNLMSTFSVLAGASNLPATPPENVYTNPAPTAGPAFYKISVHE